MTHYKHYKGNNYKVLAVLNPLPFREEKIPTVFRERLVNDATSSTGDVIYQIRTWSLDGFHYIDANEPYILYVSLDNEEVCWVRTVREFTEWISPKQQRFTLIEEGESCYEDIS